MQPTGTPPVAGAATPDPALVVRARDGDTAAWDALVGPRLSPAWRLARAILPDDAAAAEAVTNAFAAAWRELPRLDDASRFDDWLDRILLGECRMRLRAAGGGQGGAIPPVPEDLMAAVQATVAGAPRPPAPPARSRGGARRRSPWRALAAAVLVIAVVAVGVGVAATRGWLPGLASNPGSPAPGAVASPPASSDPGPTSEPSDGVPSPSASPAPLAHGTLAMVTLEGERLRVRTLPGISEASKRLKPVLPPGTRLLIVDGPVEADGYTWYEVQTDGELIDHFGWVAAGKDGVAWIAPTPARCFGEPGATTVASLSRIDFLACHGDTTVRVPARAAALWDERPNARDCGWIRRRDGCDVDAAWLLLPSANVQVEQEDGTAKEVVVAVPPDLADKLARVPRQSSLVLTLSMDSPEAAQCRARDDETGELLISQAHALTACRLQFVVQQVEFRVTGSGGPS